MKPNNNATSGQLDIQFWWDLQWFYSMCRYFEFGLLNKPLVHRHVKEITSLVNHLESWVAQDQAAVAVEKDPTNGSCYVHQSRGYFFGLSQELSSFNHLFMVTSRKIPRKNLTESGWSHCRHGPACYVRRQNQTHMTSGHMWRGRPTSETVSSTFKLKF